MADPRTDALTAIRTRLLTVPGLWPVAWSGVTYVPVAGQSYLVEDLVFGTETDAAMPDKAHNTRWRDTTEFYQLRLYLTADTDPRNATNLANLIARTILDTPITTTGGVPLWFEDYRLMTRGVVSGWQIFTLVLKYRYIYNV